MSDPDFEIVETQKYQPPTSSKIGVSNRATLTYLTIGVILLLSVFALYIVLQSRAVSFIISPTSAVLDMVNPIVAPNYGNIYLLKPGKGELMVTAPGYKTLSYPFEVTNESNQSHLINLEKKPGFLKLKIYDNSELLSDASIYVDEEFVGLSHEPMKPIEAGRRNLRVNHPLFLEHSQELEIFGKGETQELDISMVPSFANVTISSFPEGATISAYGESLGKTPKTIKLGQGIQELSLVLPRFVRADFQVKVIANENVSLPTIELIPKKGRLEVASKPNNANVSIEGIYKGQSPLELDLAPAEYNVTAIKAGYESLSKQIRIESERTSKMAFDLVPRYGYIELLNLQRDATIFIDGEVYSGSRDRLRLLARPHELKIVQEGFSDFQKSIIPNPNLVQAIDVPRITVAEARRNNLPNEIFTGLKNRLVRIDPGSFKMGAGRRQPGRKANEIEKRVRLTRPFYLAVREISNADYLKFDPSHNSGTFGRAFLNDPETPAVNVSWEAAIRFCNWLSERDGIPKTYEKINGIWQIKQDRGTGYRLPTEAEWSWAARESNQINRIFPWGDKMPPPDKFGNFADISAKNAFGNIIDNYDDTFRGPAPSGSFTANDLGIFDLAGNVSEWVNDIYSTEMVINLLVDPTGPKKGGYRVIRGSSYTQGNYSSLRLTFRDYGRDPRADVGFRIARYLE